jgi:Peptidase family M23
MLRQTNHILFCFFYLFLTLTSESQTTADTTFLKNDRPVYRGFALNRNSPKIEISDPPNILVINSARSEVFSVKEGRVANIFKLKDEYGVVISSPGNVFFGYYNLKKNVLKKGDRVKIGQLIGYLNCSDASRYQLLFKITKSDSELSSSEIIQLLNNGDSSGIH